MKRTHHKLLAVDAVDGETVIVGGRNMWDISNLESPPEDRVAVETKVTRFNNDLIRHAALREFDLDTQTSLRNLNEVELLLGAADDGGRWGRPHMTLGIGGPRESEAPGIYARARMLIAIMLDCET